MADRICDNCMSPVPVGSERCPKCGILFENTNPGGALPNGWLLGGRYTVGRYLDIDGEGVTYSAIDGSTLQRVTIKEFMPVTLCAARDETGAIKPKPGCEVLYKTTRMDYSELYAILLRMGLVEGLVQVLDVFEANNTAYAVLEKIEGPTLAEYLAKREEPIDPARALALMRPVMNGVDMLHANNIIHRGISPENIVLESGGTARLCGFGTLALRQQGSELKPKLYAGYSAPEQYAASEFEGRYTDIYALGAVIYRLVTGYIPIAADERRMQDTLRPARTLNKDIPGFLSAGIARSMRVVPAERIQNVADLRLALSGEGGREARGFLGLTKQQLIVGAAAIGAVVLLLVIVLLVSIFSGRSRGDESSSVSEISSSSTSTSVPEELIPDFTGKKYEDVVNNAVYKELYTFAQPEEAYSLDFDEGRIISQTPLGGTVWDGKTAIKLVVSLGAEPVPIPDLISTPTSQQDAEKILKEKNIAYTIVTRSNTGSVEEGTVLETSPAAGTLYTPNKDNPVIVYVAGQVSTIAMPNVVGMAEDKAVSELSRYNITSRVQYVANSVGFHMVGLVASTDPPAGGEVATGATIVNVNVYDKFYMPDLSSYVKPGNSPEALTNYLKSIGVAYTTKYVANTAGNPALNGLISSVDYVSGAEVTSSTVVTINLYEDAAGGGGSTST